MAKQKLEFIGDEVYVYTELPQYGEEVYETHLIMTKEIFQECYKRWIKGVEDGQTND